MLYTFCYVTSSNKIKFTYWLPHFIGFEEIFWHNTSFLSVEIDKLKLFKTEQMSLLSSQTYRILWLRWSKRLESVWLIMIYNIFLMLHFIFTFQALDREMMFPSCYLHKHKTIQSHQQGCNVYNFYATLHQEHNLCPIYHVFDLYTWKQRSTGCMILTISFDTVELHYLVWKAPYLHQMLQ